MPFRKLLLLLLLSSISPLTGRAQMEELGLGISLNPLPLLDFYQGGSLRLGLQAQVAPKVFLLVEGGPYLSALSYNTQDLEGYNWRVELAYNYSSWYYWSLSYFYKDHAFGLTDKLAQNGQVVERNYRLQKYANSIGIRWGRMRWKYQGRLLLDFYWGAGIRWRSVSRSGLTEAELAQIESDSIVYEYLRRSGQRVSPDLVIGVRVSGLLWRKNRF